MADNLAEGDSEYGEVWDPYMGYVRALTGFSEGEADGWKRAMKIGSTSALKRAQPAHALPNSSVGTRLRKTGI